LAVALYPIYRWLERWLNSPKFAAALATLPCIFVVLAPMAWLGFGLLNGVDIVTKKLEGGWSIPLPPASIKEWPVIGGQVYRI
jgi:predicted PurR-regulated permease PerM